MDQNNILIWGASSQAKLITKMLKAQNLKPAAYFDPIIKSVPNNLSAPHIRQWEDLNSKLDGWDKFSVAIGAEHGKVRYQIMQWLNDKGLDALSVISQSAKIASDVDIGMHAQIFMGATIHFGGKIGHASIFNTSCSVDHDCNIGNGVHIMGSAAIAGRVTIEDFATVGTNATILPDVTIGEGAFIGAGAVVTRNVPPYTVYAGVPARFLRKNSLVNASLPSY